MLLSFDKDNYKKCKNEKNQIIQVIKIGEAKQPLHDYSEICWAVKGHILHHH